MCGLEKKIVDIINLKTPQVTAKYRIGFALLLIAIDFFIVLIFRFYPRRLGYIAFAPIIIGIFGTYFSIKQKAGTKLIILNILAIFLGIVSLIGSPLVLMRIFEL